MRAHFNHYLLTLLAISYIIGIALSVRLQVSLESLSISILINTAILFIFYLGKHPFPAVIVSLLLLVQAGLYQEKRNSTLPDDDMHIYNIVKNQRELIVVGRLQGMPSYNGTTSQAVIDISAVRLDASSNLIPAKGLSLLRIRNQWPAKYEPGTLLVIHGVFQRPSGYQTPGTFDYPQHLARKNIWVTSYIRSFAQLHPVSEDISFLQSLKYVPENIRYKFGQYLDITLSPQNSSLYRALLIGDRSRIEPTVLDQFKTAGAMHILAISGLHVTLLLTLLYSFLYWLFRRSERLVLELNVKKIAGACCLPLITLYALLAGMNQPVIRACTISGIILLAFISDRPKSLPNLIAFAALLILVPAPQALYTVSFQLSFAAFISIMAISPLLKRLLTKHEHPEDNFILRFFSRLIKWAVAGLFVSSAAVLGTAPVLISHFHRFPLAGPLSNLIIEPLMCLWALPFGLAALPTSFFMPELAELLLQIGSLGFELTLKFTGMLQHIPHTSLWLPSPHIYLIVLYYLFFLGALLGLGAKISTPWSIPGRLGAVLPFLLSLILVFVPSLVPSWRTQQTPAVHVLDVGQGLACLIELPGGENILIDGGGSNYLDPTVGERIIAPFLWKRNITRLDTIIISHPDTDHYNGIPFLLDHFSPSRLWISHSGKTERQFASMLEHASKLAIDIIEAEAGITLEYDDLVIECLIDTSTHQHPDNNGNDGLVIQLRTPQAKFLFPGDINQQTERVILQGGVEVRSDVLVAAHHGSATSNSEAFLQQVAPKIIMSSSGATQKKLFPSRRLRVYCQHNRIPLLVTASDGTITANIDQDSLFVQTWNIGSVNPLRRNGSIDSAQSDLSREPYTNGIEIRLR